MTRDEQMMQAAIEVCTAHCNNREFYSFIAGVRWADKHPKSPWISIKDRLPDEGEKVIVLLDDGVIYDDKLDHELEFCIERYTIAKVTHWMPIPQMEN